MFDMINPELIAFAAKQKLDEIISGKCPDMLTEVRREGKEIDLLMTGGDKLPGFTLQRLECVFSYNEHTIKITNGAN